VTAQHVATPPPQQGAAMQKKPSSGQLAKMAEQKASRESLLTLQDPRHSSTAIIAVPRSSTCTHPTRHDSVSEVQQADWIRYGGVQLEQPLAEGWWALVDAHWLIEESRQEGALLRPRQQLPPEAFISLGELKTFGYPREAIPLIAVSYPWLSKVSRPTNYFQPHTFFQPLQSSTYVDSRLGMLSPGLIPGRRSTRTPTVTICASWAKYWKPTLTSRAQEAPQGLISAQRGGRQTISVALT